MYFTVITYNADDELVFKFKEKGLYEAFVRARVRTSGTDEETAKIYDTHGQFIKSFTNGDMDDGTN